jgi:enediyne polyketide synthase
MKRLDRDRQAETKSFPSDIAVIGMSCHYPGASELKQLWENILARRQQFRRMPDVRLPLAQYYDPDPQTPDKTHGYRAGVIDGFEFDWVNKRIPKGTFESADIVHWLALEVALKALEDAGYNPTKISGQRCGVVLGNTLTGEVTRANTMRLRWPFVARSLRAAAKTKGLPDATIADLLETMEQFYKSVFPPITEDSLAGGLSNTIAGRICNFLDFDGGGYTVDGACSSSLIAVATACNHLVNGELDLALAGGVDVSLDTFELIGFAKTKALTAGEMNVYDRKASGFIPGEGCGFAVLKRLEDARRDGDYIYSVIHGWGISSDGKGGITAPSAQGQSKALYRAYEKAGYSPHTLDFIEGHGTGTPKGDRTELAGISLAMSYDGELAPRSCGITSFKSIVGHTKAAAGIGGFIKAVIAVNQRVLPPTAGCKEPNSIFDNEAQCLYPILQGEIRSIDETLKAGVFSAGFGGINCHVAISSGDSPANSLKPDLGEAALMVSGQETELFVLSATSIEGLLDRTQVVTNLATGISLGEMVDLAAKLTTELESVHPVKAAIIASNPEQLAVSLQQLQAILNDRPPAKGEVYVTPQEEIWLSNQVKRDRVAFVFPGQGSQKLNMARRLVARYQWAKDFLQEADSWLSEMGFTPISEYIYRPLDRAVDQQQVATWSKELTAAEVASPAICFVSLLWKRYLEQLGIKPVAVAGHSLGELTAFQVAGAYDEKTLLGFAALRGRAMSASQGKAGTMASLGCDAPTAMRLIEGIAGYVVVANINSPLQTVISGEPDSITEVLQRAVAEEIQTRQLAVANAFHSEMVAEAAEYIRQEAPIPETLAQTSISLLSSVAERQILPGMNLREHFAEQMVSQVDFVALVKTLAEQCDLMVEVGSGKVLSGLVKSIKEQSRCLSVESKPERDRDLNAVITSFFILGGSVNWNAFYENRLVRPFIPVSEKVLIHNPCERPFPAELTTNNNHNSRVTQSHFSADSFVEPDWETILADYFSQRGSFLANVIKADLENGSLF